MTIAYKSANRRGKMHRWEPAEAGTVRSRCGITVPAGTIGTVKYPPMDATCIKCRYGVCPTSRNSQGGV
jgi:hypothetical protein